MTEPVTLPPIETTADEREAHARRITKCRGCGAPIVWFKTLKSKMPVNAETVSPVDQRLDLRFMVSHFATCPKSEQYRRKRQ